MVLYDRNRALELLRLGTGNPNARFRDGQEEAIAHVVEGRGRLLVVQKTGWGKSFVYFIAVKLLREAGLGPSLLVSPLLALMRNQVAAATLMGVSAVTVNSSNQKEWAAIHERVLADEVDIVIVSPERLVNQAFNSDFMSTVWPHLALLVVDEAHCVSDWGHDFRPEYRLIGRRVKSLPRTGRLLATTATANDRVMADLVEVLGPDLTVSKGELNRPSLTLQTLRIDRKSERLAWIADRLAEIPGSGIIYVLTVKDAEVVASWLRSEGLNVESYTASSADRESLENKLIKNEIKALVATVALGMGFDKPDLAFVIHFQMPGSVVAYYQQVGRAGRALDSAYGVLLAGSEDLNINTFFIESAFPTRDEVSSVLEALAEAVDGVTLIQLQRRLNVKKARIEKALDLLSFESPAPVVKDEKGWRLTPVPVSPDFWRRIDRLTELRQQELKQMQEYVNLPFGSHMEFLIRALDGQTDVLAPSIRTPLVDVPSSDTTQRAEAFLRKQVWPIEARKQWPKEGLTQYAVSGVWIPREYQANDGRALSIYGDPGWGELVQRGKYVDGRLSPELIGAVIRMVEEWAPTPAPEWLTCVPSLRHPELVPQFAGMLAEGLGLPFYPAIAATAMRPEQKTMQNSAQQALNIDGAFGVKLELMRPGPVLLVDDIADSKWTMTICAWLLRTHGGGEVWPLALALAGGSA